MAVAAVEAAACLQMRLLRDLAVVVAAAVAVAAERGKYLSRTHR